MIAFIVRRVLAALPLLLLVSFITYVLMGTAPGGTSAVLGSHIRGMTPEAKQAYIASLGLDKPWYVQYVFWLVALLTHGSLGFSYQDGRPVLSRILEKLPVTLELIGLALVVTLLVALPVGIYAAMRRGSIFDQASSAFAFAAYGVPVFWLGVVLIRTFAIQLHWLPSSGASSLGSTDPLDRLRHLILPAFTLVVVGFAVWMRYQRGSMLETLDAPYIRTARAKGLSERDVVVHHALRNALIPTITLLGLALPGLVGGAFFVEYVFTVPGMGYLALNAVFNRDYPTVMATTLLTAVFVVLGNLLADVGYAVVDPRIRYD